MKNFKGTFTALATPFDQGQLDVLSLEKLLRQQLDAGVDGFVINGTTAESPCLNDLEKEKIFSIVKSYTAGQSVLIMGTGSNSTQKSMEATQKAKKLGADAVLVVVPYYNKPPQRGLVEHFKAIAECADVPNILYNVPGRTITSLHVDSIKELGQISNIIGIKEASGKVEMVKEIQSACGKEFILLSGDDGTYVEFLAEGGHGVISVATHIIPRQMVQWKKWVHENSVDKARADIKKYARLIDLLFVEANPIPVKKALQVMQIFTNAEMRLPLLEMDARLAQDLIQEMKSSGVFS